ncbi:21893_t:CDS:2, partial [Gigaspora rosea]
NAAKQLGKKSKGDRKIHTENSPRMPQRKEETQITGDKPRIDNSTKERKDKERQTPQPEA